MSSYLVTQEYDTAISIGHSGEVDFLGLYAQSNASTSFDFVDSDSTPEIANLQRIGAPKAISIGSYDTVLVGDAEYRSSALSDFNYGTGDAGARVMDKNMAPPELDIVDEITITCQILDPSGSAVSDLISDTDRTYTSDGIGLHFFSGADTTQTNVYDDLCII